ncbi:MAG: hypothetical protein ABW137_10875 [Mycobacterium sp.]
MPIALLLQKPFATLPTLLAAAKGLTPWVEVLGVEAVLFARARGAFMIRWFGTSVPRDGSYVRIAIANRAELDNRLAEILGQGSRTAGAASITGPVTALAGMVVGTLLSPVGQVAGIMLLLRFTGFGVATLTEALGYLVVMAALVGFGPVAVVGVLAAIGLVGAAGLLLFLASTVEGVLEFAASAAGAMNALTELIGQVLGPRTEVVNPLLKAVLVLGDRLGALAVQVLGAMAFVIDQVAPRLPMIAKTLAAMRQSVSTATDALGAIIAELRDDRDRFTSGDWALGPFLARFASVAGEVVATVVTTILDAVEFAKLTIIRGYDELSVALEIHQGDNERLLGRMFMEHPTVKAILALTAALESKAEKGPKPPGLLDRLLPKVTLPDTGAILKHLAVPAPATPSWPAIQQAGLNPRPVPLTANIPARIMLGLSARAAVADMARRPSIFAEQHAQERKALGENRAALTSLAYRLSDLVNGFLTPALWERMAPALDGAVDGFVEVVYGKGAAPARPDRHLPVRRPDEPVPVRPVIGTLRLRAPGRTAEESRALYDRLLTRLNSQTYAVPATGGR